MNTEPIIPAQYSARLPIENSPFILSLMALADTYAATACVNGIRSGWASMARGSLEFAIANNDGDIVQSTPSTPPLAPDDYQAIRAQLCEAHPGDWLHHYGPAVEAEVLKRLQLARGHL